MRIITQYIPRVGFLSSSVSTIRPHRATSPPTVFPVVEDEPELPFQRVIPERSYDGRSFPLQVPHSGTGDRPESTRTPVSR